MKENCWSSECQSEYQPPPIILHPVEGTTDTDAIVYEADEKEVKTQRAIRLVNENPRLVLMALIYAAWHERQMWEGIAKSYERNDDGQ